MPGAERNAVARRVPRTESRRRVEEPARKKPKRRARSHRSAVLLRWCVVGVLGFVAFLYYRPLSSYVQTRSTLNQRQAEVSELRAEKARLQARLERSGTIGALTREARGMSLVRPGERLYVVRGIAEWRRAQRAGRTAAVTVGRDG